MRKPRFERFAVNLLMLCVLETFMAAQGAAQARGDGPASHKPAPGVRGLNGPNVALNPAPSLQQGQALPGSRPYSQMKRLTSALL